MYTKWHSAPFAITTAARLKKITLNTEAGKKMLHKAKWLARRDTSKKYNK